MKPIDVFRACHAHNQAVGLPDNINRLVKTLSAKFPKFYEKFQHLVSIKHSGLKIGRRVPVDAKKTFMLSLIEFLHAKQFCCYICGSIDYGQAARTLHWDTFPKYCSQSCVKLGPECRDKCRETVMREYGVDNVSKNKSVREKLSTENYWSTLRAEDPEAYAEALAERECTKRDRYGVNQELTSAKRMATNIKRLGVPWPTMNADVLELRRSKHQAKYGCDDPSQRPEIMAKIYANRKTSNLKRIVVSGKRFTLQGYEPKALMYMVGQGLDVRKVSKPNVAVSYTDDSTGKHRVYHPDFHIKGSNGRQVLVEVKSTYTAGLDKCKGTYYHKYSTLRAKAQAVIDLGYEFLLLVMQEKNNEVLIQHVGPLPKDPKQLFVG